MLKKRKYRLLYTARRKGKPGPKGPSQELIDAIVELKRRNTRFGCPRIAQQINKAFGVNIAAACSNFRLQLELQFAMHR